MGNKYSDVQNMQKKWQEKWKQNKKMKIVFLFLDALASLEPTRTQVGRSLTQW